ncbi:hypothetical protein [Photobacterium lipolyticum]|uniref:Uncharacterized protein n=1 Tax=Photobacterium lipolyticum TaxID=266810 RepID=A0A2T3N0J4_9GAMM|nr:hypothetical protein [Photobacterium lipolyticum]PSW05697.1 hypothetical protein C9I89_08100 [Photobacterium lipolyticum]
MPSKASVILGPLKQVPAYMKRLPTPIQKASESKYCGYAKDHVGDAIGLVTGSVEQAAEAAKTAAEAAADTGIDFVGPGPIGDTVSTAIESVQAILEWAGQRKGKELPANPLLQFSDVNRRDMLPSTVANTKCHSYFKKRMIKKIAGSAYSTTGSWLAGATQVNVNGAIRHGRSSAKTIAHIARFKQLLDGFKRQGYEAEIEMCKSLLRWKATKLTSQGCQLAADLIPGSAGAPIAGAVISGAASLGTAAYMRREEDLIASTAQMLHKRAFMELSNNMDTEHRSAYTVALDSPAVELVREMFNQIAHIEKEKVLIDFHGHKLKVGGEYLRADKFMREPAGWLVLVDKLSLL